MLHQPVESTVNSGHLGDARGIAGFALADVSQSVTRCDGECHGSRAKDRRRITQRLCERRKAGAASSLADPPITLAEALAVDLAQATTLCRLHRGQHTHLNVDGRVYFCPIGRIYWRHTKRPSEFLKPLRYR